MDLTYIVMDNEVYGMTKGQASPTTQPDWTHSKLTPRGTGVRRFQPPAIALAAGPTRLRVAHDLAAAVESAADPDGRLDIAVANAGSGVPGPILTLAGEHWRFVNDLNIIGTALTIKRAALAMQQHGPPVDNGDGSETVTLRLSPPFDNNSRWFVRLRVAME